MPNPWESKWQFGDQLGKGGQGVTHRVESLESPGTFGALKFLKNNKSPQARARMRQEVVALQSLAPLEGFVPGVLDENSEAAPDGQTQLYVVMELIPGPTLREYVEDEGPLDIDTAAAMTLRIAETIADVHKYGVIHRDIKPDNIILRNGSIGDVVIVDYGLSFSGEEADLTRTHENFQNEFIALPENNTPDGLRRDPRSDLTCVAGLLYYCLTGKFIGHLFEPPHLRQGKNLKAIHEGDARIPRVEAFLTRALTPNIENRYQSSEELVRNLISIIEASKELDNTDPIQRAAQLSERLRQSHRPTQLHELQMQLKKVDPFLNDLFGRYVNKLGYIRLDLMMSGPVQHTPPDGFDLVRCFEVHYDVQTAHCGSSFQRHYFVIARGEDCRVMAADWQGSKTHGGARAWQVQEVAQYSGDPTPILPLIEKSFDEWLNYTIDGLANMMMPRE